MLGQVLGWKFNYYQGITTREETLVNWPAELGPRPTPGQEATWQQEYLASIEDANEDANRATASRIQRITELASKGPSTWTTAQLRELVKLLADVLTP